MESDYVPQAPNQVSSVAQRYKADKASDKNAGRSRSFSRSFSPDEFLATPHGVRSLSRSPSWSRSPSPRTLAREQQFYAQVTAEDKLEKKMSLAAATLVIARISIALRYDILTFENRADWLPSLWDRMDRGRFPTPHSIRSAEFKAAVYEAWNEDEAIIASCVEKLFRSEPCNTLFPDRPNRI